MKRLLIFGSTGSIGTSTLDVVRRFPGRFRVVGLSSNARTDEVCAQAREFRPRLVCVGSGVNPGSLRAGLPRGTKVLCGSEGLQEMAAYAGADEAVMAISGSSALLPLLRAIEAKKQIVLANKESLAMAGPLVMRRAARALVAVKPVDSEQSAVWQCLLSQAKDGARRQVRTLYLTASGGPFREYSAARLRRVTVREALRHPRWKMGRKITVDSATLMNKGLEVIEAQHLFGISLARIKVVVHPEALVHSMVEFTDGSLLAQLSVTDMRLPIQFALSYPERLVSPRELYLDPRTLGQLRFGAADERRFPCLALAYEAARAGGTAPCVLNAANEICVEAFLAGELPFCRIAAVIAKVLCRHRSRPVTSLGAVFDADRWAREEAKALV